MVSERCADIRCNDGGIYPSGSDGSITRSTAHLGPARRTCHAILPLASRLVDALNMGAKRRRGRTAMRHGGKILIDQLEAQGATTAFTVPGESFLAALDGLHDSNRIKTIICRQEGGASMMAEAWGKITGEPGVCFVTRGPGLANAMSGLHVAQQDSTPMVLFVGLPESRVEDREA